jgi:uncharacterized paraquat-inducible protein A
MDNEISPVMRVIAIAVLVLTPVALVILQRLEALREIKRKRQNGELDLSFDGLFSRDGKANTPQPAEAVCPQCHKSNPADHQFCGYCGALLTTKKGNEK